MIQNIAPSALLSLVNDLRIWTAIAAACFTVITAGLGWWQLQLQAIVSAEKDRAFETYKAEAAERTAKAHELAAESNARAAEANLKAEQERLERVRLELRIAPRSLSAEQKSVLVQYAGVEKLLYEVILLNVTPEIASIGRSISDALKEGGSDVVLIQWSANATVDGVAVISRPNLTAELNGTTMALMSALRHAGLDVSIMNWGEDSSWGILYGTSSHDRADYLVGTADIRIMIGPKPQ